jgi:hypothetical protein
MNINNYAPSVPQPYRVVQVDLVSSQIARQALPGFLPVSKSVEYSRIPSGSVFIGLSENDLPLLLDLYHPDNGPVLVAGDSRSGKTTMLRSMAYFSGMQDPGDIQFGVITHYPEEWRSLESLPHSLGIWPAYHPSSQTFLSQMINWTESLARTRQAILLLFDGLDLLTGCDSHIRQSLHWLLLNGPACHVWPVVTLNAARLVDWKNWIPLFHTCVIGQVKQAQNARLLLSDQPGDTTCLLPGRQFILSQSGNAVKFNLPPID